MKKFLLSLVSLFVLAIGNIWADEVYYTLDATSADVQTDNNSYANIGTATVGEIEWKFQGNGKINPWRLGGKNLTDEDRVVYTSTAMDVAITSVKLEVGNASNITVNSLKLIVASDAEFNTVIDEVSKDFEANSVISFEPTSPATDWAENSYYKFVFNVSVSGGSNRFVEFMKVEFLKAEGGDNPPVTVAKPTITPSASFIGSTTVTITAEDGTDIYYTVDGTTPTTESTKYTAAFAITETTTVKAIAVKDGVTSSEATATFTLIPSYSSISAVTALTSNDVFVFTGEALIVAKPTANHVYIQDETGSALLYDSTGEKTAAAEVGKTMAANWSGKVSIYKKLFEIVPDQAIAVKDGDAATVTYPEATAEDITLENVNKVVLLKGITSYSVDGKNLTITIGENEIAGYNQFGLEIAAAEDGKTYEMVGAISRYNDNAQFQPMSIKEVGEPAPTELELTLNVSRYPGMGYSVTEAAVDFAEAKEFLGVEKITSDMLRVVNPDGTEIADYAGYDGWFDGEGVATNWGDNTKICVKFFQAVEGGTYQICDMNGADEVGKTYTVKWALVANDKKVFYTINVEFIEKPVIAITFDDLNVVETVTSDFEFEVGTCYQGATATVDVAAILAKLDVESLDDITIFAVRSDGTLDDNYKLGTTDGWRNAAGDWQTWGADAYFYVKADFSAAESQLYDVGTMDPGMNANIKADDVFTAKYAFVKDNDAHDAVVLDVVVTMTPTVGINGIALDAEKNVVYDLAGRRVKNVVKGNLYIVNGKKVLVK